MGCIQCKGDTKVHKTVKNHDFYVLRTRECLRCGHRFKTLEIFQSMPMTQAVEQMKLMNRCQEAVEHFNQVWAKTKEHAARYKLLKG